MLCGYLKNRKTPNWQRSHFVSFPKLLPDHGYIMQLFLQYFFNRYRVLYGNVNRIKTLDDKNVMMKVGLYLVYLTPVAGRICHLSLDNTENLRNTSLINKQDTENAILQKPGFRIFSL